MSEPRVIAVASGKGGVGKTSVVVGLARALCAAGHRVGVLDADLYGPDVPLLLGVTRTVRAKHINVWRAPDTAKRIEPLELDGLRVMSIQFLLAESQSFAASGPLAGLFVQRLWTGVDWGDLDYLLVDLPPGTGDISRSVVSTVPIDAAVVVVTPQNLAHLDTQKLLDFLRTKEVPVLGGVENMTTTECPHCGTEFPLFAEADAQRSIWRAGVTRLAGLPFDETVTRASHPAFTTLADQVTAALPPKR
jgi:ATP-binding protein involved in chromosome partitioning